MTGDQAGAWTRTSRVIKAQPLELYEALMDPAALVAWLPPGNMRGEIHDFDPWVGGGYRMSLYYPRDERAVRGKTTDREDRFRVRFVELTPPASDCRSRQFRNHRSGFLRRDDYCVDVRRGSRRNEGHGLVPESTARFAGRGQ